MAINRYYLPESGYQTGMCIFISHQKKDSAAARKIADYFISAGIDVYFDEYDGKINRDSPASVVNAIKTGIRRSTHMLCLLSVNALESKWVPWEVGYGYDRTEVVGLTLKELSMATLPEYLQVIPILKGTASLNGFISRELGRGESSLIREGRMFSANALHHPLDEVLNWQL